MNVLRWWRHLFHRQRWTWWRVGEDAVCDLCLYRVRNGGAEADLMHD